MNDFKEHTFVICAYKESEYLEECIKSLLGQTVKSKILMCTSTPSLFLEELAKQYHLELRVNPQKNGIGADWNFAVSQAETKFVTVAHQDDVYTANYTENVQKAIEKENEFLIAFTNYQEIREGKVVKNNINLMIKSMMLFPIRISNKAKWIKKLVLSLGNPICCPSVCLNTEKVGKEPYEEDMKSNIDWGTWLKFAKRDGKFIYLKEKLVCHRIHQESETSKCLNSDQRKKEDYEMFCRIWPKWFAKFLMIFYQFAGKSNELKR